MPFGGPTHERLAPVDDESPQTTSSGDVWAQRQHGTCNSSANATGFDRVLTYSPPFFVRAHQTTKEDCTPGTLKASQVALVEPVAYLKDLVISLTRPAVNNPHPAMKAESGVGSVPESCAMTPRRRGAHSNRAIARKALAETHRTNHIDIHAQALVGFQGRGCADGVHP